MSTWLKGKLGKALKGYGGELTAGMTPELQMARDLLTEFDPSKYQGQQEDALTNILSGKPSYDVSEEALDKYMRETVAQPMYREYEREIAPRIKEAFVGTGGAFSSRRAEAQANSLTDIGQAITAERGRASWQAQALQAQLNEGAANRQMQGIPLAGQMAMQQGAGAALATDIGGVFQNYEQQGLDRAYNEWMRTRPEYSPYVGYANQYLGQSNMALYQTPGSDSSGLGGGLGALAGAGLGALLAAPTGGMSIPMGMMLGSGAGMMGGSLIGGSF